MGQPISPLKRIKSASHFADLASDGARGILKGIREAPLAVPVRPDLVHPFRDAHRGTGQLERAAYRALETAERARRAGRKEAAPKRRRGPRLKVTVPEAQAKQGEGTTRWSWPVWRKRPASARCWINFSPSARRRCRHKFSRCPKVSTYFRSKMNHPRIRYGNRRAGLQPATVLSGRYASESISAPIGSVPRPSSTPLRARRASMSPGYINASRPRSPVRIRITSSTG